MSVQLLYKALTGLLVFFMGFSSVISSKPDLIAVLITLVFITLSQFLLGFSCFSSVTVCTINYDINLLILYKSSALIFYQFS